MDLKEHTEPQLVYRTRERPNSVLFHPVEDKFAVARSDGKVQMYDFSDLSKPLMEYNQGSSALGVGFRQIGKSNRSRTPKRNCANQRCPHGRRTQCLYGASQREFAPWQFSPDGKLLLTGCLDKFARLWDIETGKMIGSPVPTPIRCEVGRIRR